jgi:hypothetical protein
MVYWIKKIASILGITVFFLLLIFSLAGGREYTLQLLFMSLLRAFFGASLAWVAGIVIADILLKGVQSDIESDRKAALLEGGLLQRIQSMRETAVPGGVDMPFTGIAAVKKQDTGGKP